MDNNHYISIVGVTCWNNNSVGAILNVDMNETVQFVVDKLGPREIPRQDAKR